MRPKIQLDMVIDLKILLFSNQKRGKWLSSLMGTIDIFLPRPCRILL
jgi:hypothetical protein